MKVVLSGGGTGGHVYPNIPIIEQLLADGHECAYIGQQASIEEQTIAQLGIPFYSTPTTKFRRSKDLRNVMIPAVLTVGIGRCVQHLRKLQPQVVFSKGGYVAVPVVLAARALGIPVVIHESDRSPGLATRISMTFANTICTTLPQAYLLGPLKNHPKVVHTGIPVRSIFVKEQPIQDPKLQEVTKKRPYVLIFGGSLGSKSLNQLAEELAEPLRESHTIIRLAGKQYDTLEPDPVEGNLCTLKAVSEDMAALIRQADVVICRSGMTTLVELAALNKRPILVPLPTAASRGDQLENAQLTANLDNTPVIEEGPGFTNRVLDALREETHSPNRSKRPSVFSQIDMSYTQDRIIKLLYSKQH